MVIAVYCEAHGSGGLELLGKAKALGATAVALTETTDCARVFVCGADRALCVGLSSDDCAQGSQIACALDALKPDAALFPATIRGRFLSAWVAAKLGTGLTADCTALSLTADGLLEQSRPAFGGNLTADILCRTHRPQLASVRPGVFPIPDEQANTTKQGQTPVNAGRAADANALTSAPSTCAGRAADANALMSAQCQTSAPSTCAGRAADANALTSGQCQTSALSTCAGRDADAQAPASGKVCEALTLAPIDALLQRLDFTPVEDNVSLQTASVIVAGGKGVGGKAGFDKLFELAELLGGAVGATRSAVDANWISYAHQIGQTGVTVHPKLYIGFGISGLVQHTVGMNGAKLVIAVNKDRSAPIFQCADFGVVADWQTTADAMIRHFRERKVTL